jgi:glycosyltransferase involved in cell wall biosynthesis
MKMKVAILGSRGIPNQYGGYEGFAEEFSVTMAARGHEITVFNSSLHPYHEKKFNGVEIISCFDPEDKLGTAGQFIYDLNCIRACRNRSFDIILQLGYTSSSVWGPLLPRNAVVITNMDGLEWRRSKYSAPVRRFLALAEKQAVRYSDLCIADNPAIQTYLNSKFNIQSQFIPYGACLINEPDIKILQAYQVKPYSYNLIVARLEPENNIETIIKGHIESNSKIPLLITGAFSNKYGQKLRDRYSSDRIIFMGGIFETYKLNALRWFSNIYFHGHSVGGTNPSLLQAMAASALICAHSNDFNREVLNDDGFYFTGASDVATLLNKETVKSNYHAFIDNNRKKIAELYNPEKITDQYELMFTRCLNQHEKRRHT